MIIRRCGVVQASFDRPHWCGPHPVCLWVALALGRRPHPNKISIFAIVFAGFFPIDAHRKPCNFFGFKFARFLINLKDAPPKVQFFGNNKSGKSAFVSQQRRMASKKWVVNVTK